MNSSLRLHFSWIILMTTMAFLLLPELTSSATIPRKKVLLVSMDGFRYDYLTKANTPNFDTMIKKGVTMPYMNSTYVTLTFPCHYSIATGLYEESHGIIGNSMYDPDTGSKFWMGNVEPKWWDGGEPIWISARKSGLKVGTFFWPGSEVPHNGTLPNKWRKYDGSIPYEDRVRTVAQWLAKDDFDLALLYFDEPDHSGHSLGPDNPELVPVIKRMDSILGLIVEELKLNNILDRVNLIITSDHGMASVNTKTRLIDVSDSINNSDLKWMKGGPVAQMVPQPNKTVSLLNDLKNVEHMKVMLKEDIPEEKHYKNNRRVSDIFAEAEEGWQITRDRKNRLTYPFLGDHGYDNDYMSMKPIFVAMGPDFKTNEEVEPIKNIDIYPLICHMLGIDPAPNNGSLSRSSQLLKNINSTSTPTDSSSQVSSSLWKLVSFLFVSLFMLSVL